MKKRLMVGLLSAGLLAAMLPGVVAADKSWVCVGYHADGPYTGKIIVPTGQYCGLNPDSPVTGNIEVGGYDPATGKSGHVRLFPEVQMMGKITVVEPGGQVNLNGDVFSSSGQLLRSGSRMYGKIECESPGILFLYSGAVLHGNVEGCTIRYP
jgi:hypothetical protein